VPVIAEYLKHNVESDAVIVAPDAGGGKLARRFADRLGADIAFIDKRRPKGTHNVAVATEVVGDIDGRTCIIVDDMIDTAGTVVSAANLLIDRGATSVYIAATHGLLSGPAVDRLKNGPIREVVVTDTVPIPDDKRFDTLHVLSIAPLLAEAIDAVFEDGSVSELFGGDNM
jgi:ribose-phosphate pyrophosphokinase